MSPERLSHAYCPNCDITFLARARCPKCFTYDLIHPPSGSPPVRQRDKGRQWIARESQTAGAAP